MNHPIIPVIIFLIACLFVNELRRALKLAVKSKAYAWNEVEARNNRILALEAKCNKFIGEKANESALNHAVTQKMECMVNEIAALKAELKRKHRRTRV